MADNARPRSRRFQPNLEPIPPPPVVHGWDSPGPSIGGATQYVTRRAPFEIPPSDPLFGKAMADLDAAAADLAGQLRNHLASNPPPLGDETGPFLPYLLVRSFVGDNGQGRPLSYLPDFLSTPDIWVLPEGTDPIPPNVGTHTLLAGMEYRAYAHVWNLGRAPISGVKVEFFMSDRPGCTAGSPGVPVGTARVNLPPPSSPDCHQLVKCPNSFTAPLPVAPMSITVRLSCIPDPFPTTNPIDPVERHMARRDFNPTLLGLSDGEIFHVDPITGAVTEPRAVCTLPPSPVCLVGWTGIAFFPNMILPNGACVAYGLTNPNLSGDNTLYKIVLNSDMPIATIVGHTQDIAEGDLARDPTNDDLYALYRTGPPRLLKLNTANGEASFVGPLAGVVDPSAMAFDDSGQLYVLDGGGASCKLLRVDKMTAATMPPSPITVPGIPPHAVAGMVYRRGNGDFLVTTGQVTSGVPTLWTLSTTGTTTNSVPLSPAIDFVGLTFGF